MEYFWFLLLNLQYESVIIHVNAIGPIYELFEERSPYQNWRNRETPLIYMYLCRTESDNHCKTILLQILFLYLKYRNNRVELFQILVLSLKLSNFGYVIYP